MDIKAAIQIEEARRTTDEVMDMLMKDEEFKEVLERKLREHGLHE